MDDAERSLDKMKAIDPEILCGGHDGVAIGKELARKHLRMNRQSIEDFKAFVVEKIQSGWSIEQIVQDVTARFSKGPIDFFLPKKNIASGDY